jgi:superfamily II DNA or RNA helicase
MSAHLTKLLASLRRSCKAGLWSAGVNLVRAGAVAVESRNDEEIVLRVCSPGRAVAPTVVLYPGENEWDCDCTGRVRPCEHLAAAAIALTREPSEGSRTLPRGCAAGGAGGLPTRFGQGEAATAGDAEAKPVPKAEEAWARIVYRFSQIPGGLQLRRFVVRGDGSEAPLQGTLSALLSRPAEAGNLHVEQYDLQADRILESGSRATLSPPKLDALVRTLVGARLVFLDGREVAMSEEELLPSAFVEDRGDEVVVTIHRDARITQVPSAGLVLAGEALARHGEIELCGAWLQNLPIVKTYALGQLAELATRVLPDLSRRMVVEVRSKRLPKIVRGLAPRLVLDMSQLGSSLAVLPKLVYGNPPCVRIDDGRMVHLSGPVPVRDEPAERRLVEKLRADLDLMPGRRSTFEGADTARFVDKVKRWRGDLAGDGARLLGARVRLEPNMRVRDLPTSGNGVPQAGFDFTFTVVGETEAEQRALGPGPHSVDAATVIRAWEDGLGLVPLVGGGFAPLPQAWLDQHGAVLARLLAARASDGRLANHALLALAGLCDDLDQPPPAGLERLAPLAESFDRLPEAKLPEDLRATLRPYQKIAVNWLAFLRSVGLGGILADDMGLGKTIEAMCLFEKKCDRVDEGGLCLPESIAGRNGNPPRVPMTIVVCPTSVLPNWQAEMARFRPSLRVSVYHGPARKLDQNADVILTTYAILRLDSAELSARHFDMVVLDEAQAIKNPDSQVARAAYALSAEFRLAMTGTPVENRLDELWSLMHFANRGLLGGRHEFDAEFAGPVADGIAGAAANLRQRIRPFVMRRRKAEVAPELPPRTEATLKIVLDERERAAYDAVRAATQAELVASMSGADEKGFSVMKALEALLRLRQAACHRGLLPGQKADSSGKVEALLESLETAAADGHKALVFSQWTSLLDLIEPALNNAGILYTRLDGSTRDRGEVVERFQSDDGPPVMLISLKAGGTGLNLTAADHVFLCDPWWNPAVEDQAADRAHRIGQDRPVTIYRLIAVDTVEERILDLQQKKRALGEAALGDGGAAASLTREDLLALLA